MSAIRSPAVRSPAHDDREKHARHMRADLIVVMARPSRILAPVFRKDMQDRLHHRPYCLRASQGCACKGGSVEASAPALTLQLLFLRASESMGNHDSKIVDAGSVD